MSSIINSTTTSPGGLISTGDSANSLLIQTGDTTAITINSSQQVALTNPLGAASGGTGLSSPGTSGNVLQSNGSAWVSAAFSAGFSGGTTTTSAVDITLTSSSVQSHSITMTAANKKVTLPDATTMTKGGIAFYIGNDGGYFFNVVDSTGAVISQISTYQSVALMLVDNSTAAGTWLPVTGWTKYSYVTQDTTNVLSGGSVSVSTCMVSDTAGVVIYKKSTEYVYVRAFTFNASTNALTWGTEVQVDSTGSLAQVPTALFRLTDTTFFLGYYNNGAPARAVGVVGTLSGSSISLGTPAVFVSMTGTSVVFNSGAYFAKLSATSVACIWDTYTVASGATTFATAAATISGTSLSVGNTTSLSTSDYSTSGGPVIVLGSTMVAMSGGTGLGKGIVWTISGNTSSSFTETTGLTGDYGMNPVRVSSTSFFSQNKNGNPVYLTSISGTTISQAALDNTGVQTPVIGFVDNTYMLNTGSVVPYAPTGLATTAIQSLGKSLRSNTVSSCSPDFQVTSGGYLALSTSTNSFTSAYVVIYRVL